MFDRVQVPDKQEPSNKSSTSKEEKNILKESFKKSTKV